MINIEEVAIKLNKILNGTDSSVSGYNRNTDLYFKVRTAGGFIDHTMDLNVGVNFIPVFIDLMGGEYDPIPNLSKGTFTIPVTIYFPVRFKKDFYDLNEFLVKALVGKVLNWGTYSGNCLSTISVATYGEIQDLDLKKFKEWVANKYQKQIEVMEPYRSMEFTLYLQSGHDMIYGNQIFFEAAYTYNGVRYPSETGYYELKTATSSSGVNNDPISEQLINVDAYAKSVANITNRSKSVMAYVENNVFWKNIIKAYNDGTIDEILSSLEIRKKYNVVLSGDTEPTSFEFDYNLVTSITENREIGSPLSFTFTIIDRYAM